MKHKTCRMATLMIKAIKEFNKQHKGCEIRKIYPLEGGGYGKGYSNVLFGIEYIDQVELSQYTEISANA